MEYNNHIVSEASISILHKDSDWFRRGVAEAIRIEQHSPNLNRGRERHTLPKIYEGILPRVQSRDSSVHVTEPD